MALTDASPTRFGARFALLVLGASFYFIGLGVVAPVLPHYVEDVLGGGGVQVGIVVGAFAVSAALLRSTSGRIGDARGRRVLVVGGCLIAGLSILGYGFDGLVVLILLRLLTGVGEAALFVGAATTAQDMAPAARRGQAASLFSIAVYGGLAIGPAIGEWIYRNHGAPTVWAVGGGLCLFAGLIGTSTPDIVETAPKQSSEGRRRFLHPAATRFGLVLACGGMGYAGFSSFLPLYVKHLGMNGAGPVFIEYAALILSVRIIGSRLPDVLGTRRGPLLALVLQAIGLATMSLSATRVALFAATVPYAVGVSLLYPSLFPAVVDAAPEHERSHAIASFTMFFDLAQGLGAPLLGVVVALTSERWAFLAAGVASAIGWWLLWSMAVPAGSKAFAPLPPEPGE